MAWYGQDLAKKQIAIGLLIRIGNETQVNVTFRDLDRGEDWCARIILELLPESKLTGFIQRALDSWSSACRAPRNVERFQQAAPMEQRRALRDRSSERTQSFWHVGHGSFVFPITCSLKTRASTPTSMSSSGEGTDCSRNVTQMEGMARNLCQVSKKTSAFR